MNNSTDIKKQKPSVYPWLLALIFFIPNINYYISFIFYALGSRGTTVILYSCVCVLALFAYVKTIFKSWIPFLCLLTVAFLYAYTLVFWPQNEQHMFGDLWDAVYNPLYRIVLLGIPLLFLPQFIDNYSEFYSVFCGFAWFNLGIALVAYFAVIIGLGQEFEYMTFSYNMLFATSVCFFDSRKRHSPILIGISLLGFIATIVIGSRGAMLCAVLSFVFSFFVIDKRESLIKQIIFLSVFGICFAIVLVSYKTILLSLVDFLKRWNFESRSLEEALEGTILNDDTRKNLTEIVQKAITQNPVFGYGIFGDRQVIALARGKGTYAHNVFLEWLCQYGVFVGGLICVSYVYNSVTCIFYKTDYRLKILYVSLFSSVFLKLLVSSSYLTDPSFFMLIGFIIAIKKRKAIKYETLDS